MPYRIEKDEETGKYKLYNKDKKTYAKRMFSTKETAQKMADRYVAFADNRKKPKVKKEEE